MPFHAPTAALLVFAGYCAGAWLGFELRFPPAATSVLWPPNALLTAALIMAPPRGWWVCLAAALPAHLLVGLGTDLPGALVGAFFVTNCSEALIAAGLVHRFNDQPARFDTFRRAVVFVAGAVLLAPFLSCFLDAAAVSLLRGDAYWEVWRTRLYANTLTELTLVPALVALVSSRVRGGSGLPWPRVAEAAALAALLVGAGMLLFGSGLLRWNRPTSLTLLLPLLLWAAARFGSAGASLALLGTALLAIAAATRGGTPMHPLPAEEAVVVLQIFLTTVGVPLFALGALMEERRGTERLLAERLRFQALVSHLSGAFVQLPSDAMSTAFTTWLRQVGEFFGARRLLVARVQREGPEVLGAWSADGLLPPAGHDLPFVLRGEGGWTSFPLVVGTRVLGALSIEPDPGQARTDEGDQRLLLVAEVFGSALARKETEDALRASEEMKSSILSSLTGLVAVLDREGRIIAVNESWARTAEGGGLPVGVGANYLAACGSTARPGLPASAEAREGIRRVLAGAPGVFDHEYTCAGPHGTRWFAMSVVPLRRPEGGAVVGHTDVTEARSAEAEARVSREELAHFLRVSTVGELTTSLAHELNQPLAAILANAQAALLSLEGAVNAEELREVLGDIADEGRRAGDLIRRIREMLRKHAPERAPLSLNALVADAAGLLGGDAVIRNVALRLDLDPRAPVVSADRVQIQQVVINLLLNALEAMDLGARTRREVVVRTLLASPHAQVSVEDTGPGLRDDAEGLARVFEPFYTTKPAGIGMGLAIARTILEAHEGTITAWNNADAGATFSFSLPLAGGTAASREALRQDDPARP
ncbi:MAG TPA: MASE1 domain-containing protein [Vicinamibacteria bacterium]